MSAATDARAAVANAAMADTIGRVQAGHLAAQRALWAVREGASPKVIDEARTALGDDAEALVAFARSIARGRE